MTVVCIQLIFSPWIHTSIYHSTEMKCYFLPFKFSNPVSNFWTLIKCLSMYNIVAYYAPFSLYHCCAIISYLIFGTYTYPPEHIYVDVEINSNTFLCFTLPFLMMWKEPCNQLLLTLCRCFITHTLWHLFYSLKLLASSASVSPMIEFW